MSADSSSQPRGRRTLARIGQTVALVACVLVVAAAALTLALSRGWQRERLGAWLEGALADGLGAEVSIGALEGPLLPTFTLRDVRIASYDGSRIAWESLDARIDATALLTRRELVVEHLALDRPTVVLVRGAAAGSGLASEGDEGADEAAAAPGLGVPIGLREVEVSDARWRIESDARPVEGVAQLHAWELALPLRPEGLRRSRGTLEIGIAPTSIGDVALERGDVRAALADGALTLAIDGLEGPAGRLHGQGEADLAGWLEGRDEAHAELTLGFASLDLEALVARPEAASALSGTLELAARRPASAPSSASELRFTLSLDPSRLAVGPVETARATGRLGGGSWVIESLAVQAAAFDLEARGRGRSSELEAISGSARVPALERLAPWLPKGWTLAGGVTIDAELEGPIDSLSGHGSLRSSGLVVRDVTLGTVEARIASETPGVLRVEAFEARGGALEAKLLEPARITTEGGVFSERLALAVAGQPLTLDGGLSGAGFRGLRVRAEGVEVAPLARLAGLEEPLTGRAEADLTLDGALARPRLSGTLDLAPVAVGDTRAERLTLVFSPHDGMLDATARVRALGREVLSAQLQAPLDSGSDPFARSETRLEVQSDGFELALLAPFLPRGLRQPGGRLDLALRVAGGRPTPTIDGTVTLAGGRLGVPLVGQVFEPIEGHARVSGARLVVDSLRIGGKGTAELQGSVDFAQLEAPRADLTLSLDGFPLSRTRLLTTDASGRIALSGPLRAPAVQGELSLSDALLRLPEPEDATLREIRVIRHSEETAQLEIREGAAAGGAAQAGWLEAAALDLALEVPRNSWVRGGGAELDVTGTVRVQKDHASPARFVGEAEAVRGSYTFQGRRFRVRRGTATFDGAPRPDPLLDVEAAYRVRDVTIVALLTGRASDPQLRLVGEPPMSDADLLAYLMFGGPADELTAGEGVALGDAAAKAASGIAAGELAALLGDATPVDTIELDAGDAGQPAGFAVGKYVGDRVFLRYGRTLGPRPTDEVRTELRITPRVSIESQITTDETGGLDVIWSYDY